MARKLRVTEHDVTYPRQFSVGSYDNEEYESLSWGDYYVNASGYFGNIGPHVFAAAPELLEALVAASEYLDYHNIPVEIVAMVDFAIAKAKGETNV